MPEEKRIYVGHRYVPLITGEWSPLISYEGLSIVLNQGDSYTSKKRVPVGVQLDNEEYWVVTGNYNAQIENYRLDVKNVKESTAIQFSLHPINITTLEELINVNNLNVIKKINIGKQIDITQSLVLNDKLIIQFSHEGKFLIKANTSLTLNSYLDVGLQHIFDFENETAVLTTDAVKLGTQMNSSKVHYSIKPEWFGAKADGYPSNRYLYEAISSGYGTNNLQAFKRTQKFAEECSAKSSLEPNKHINPTVTVELTNNGMYTVKGNNPFGIQSTIADVGYSLAFDGNGSTIIWEALTPNDSLFGKYGRVVRPNIKNLNVVLVGAVGKRWGSFVDSKTNEGDIYHLWSGGEFQNLRLGTHTSVGFDKVFNVRIDGGHSHDDLTLLTNVGAQAYNTFLNIENREAVNWKLDKCIFISNTPEAKHIVIADNFSGGLTIDSPDILMREMNEVFLKVGDGVSGTPIKVINGRMETRNSLPFTFVDSKGGNTIINNVQFIAGNTENAHVDTRTAKLGEKAYIRFEDCTLYDQFDLTVSTISGQKQNALYFDNCTFMALIRSTKRSLGYPTINYMVNGLQRRIAEVVKLGLLQRKITVSNPTITDGGLLLPIIYPTSGSNAEFKTEIFKLKTNGNPSLNLSGINSLPPNIAITDIKLFATSIDTTKVDRVSIQFYIDRESPSVNASLINHDFLSNDNVVGLPLLTGKIMSIPNRNYINITLRKNAVTVTDEALFPTCWLEVTYRALSKRTDFIENDEGIGTKDILTSF